jgi:hypothetical protein
MPRRPADSPGLSAPYTQSGKLQRALLALLKGPKHLQADALPTSNRFVYYELGQMGVINKDSGLKRPDNPIIVACTHLRELGLARGGIPWDWIVDETRTLDEWGYASTIARGVVADLRRQRLNCWGNSPPPMILTESRSLAGVLRRIAAEYLCPIAATNGQTRGFLHTVIAPALVPGQEVLYLGDLDDAGGHIEENTRRVLEDLVGPLKWTRLALTIEQVREYRVPKKMKLDRRYKDGGKRAAAYETEALSQVVIQDLLREALEERLPEPLEVVRAREERQQNQIRRMLTVSKPPTRKKRKGSR